MNPQVSTAADPALIEDSGALPVIVSGTARRTRPDPGIGPFVVAFVGFCILSAAVFDPHQTPLGWYVTVAWSLPAAGSVIGIWGALIARDRWMAGPEALAFSAAPVSVLIPTIGRHDVLPGLTRTVDSFVRHMPAHHSNFRIDVVCEEHSEARDVITARWADEPTVRVTVIPAAYETANRTGFKARANQYMLELRRAEGEATHLHWTLHMDDDTSCSQETAAAVAAFIRDQNDPDNPAPKHVAQGVLTYPREAAVNTFTWLADAVRPADDLSRFAAITGGGTPLAGMHGELMLTRAAIEDGIGWDFGPDTIVEDARWALEFSARHPGRSAWIPACCYGASPSNVRSLIAQRKRWAWGLVMLSLDRRVPLRRRAFMAYSVMTWVLGPLQHVAAVLGVGLAVHEASAPAAYWVIPLWALSMGYVAWMYWTGLRVNQWASAQGGRWWQMPAVLALIPVFSALEGYAAFRGLLYAISRRPVVFTVIGKEA